MHGSGLVLESPGPRGLAVSGTRSTEPVHTRYGALLFSMELASGEVAGNARRCDLAGGPGRLGRALASRIQAQRERTHRCCRRLRPGGFRTTDSS